MRAYHRSEPRDRSARLGRNASPMTELDPDPSSPGDVPKRQGDEGTGTAAGEPSGGRYAAGASGRRRWLRAASIAGTAAAAGLPLRTVPAQRLGGTPPEAARPPRPARKGGIAVALGSGSRHGLVHAGVIRALETRGFRPDIVTGTSAGAIAGALWASGLNADQIQRASASLDWLRGLRFALPRRGLLHSDAVRNLIDLHTGGRPIEQWTVHFAAVSTDLHTGRKVVLDRGPAGPAVAASASIPALYEPVRIDERDLVDGGLVEPVPVRTALDMGAAYVIAVDIAYRPWEAPVDHAIDAAFQALHIAVNALIAEQIAAADVVLRLDVHRHFLELDDPSAALAAAGEQAVAVAWDRIRTLKPR
jgi:NTE family protein